MRSPRRAMCAAVLGFQCIVLGLSTPVMITVEGVSTPAALTLGLGLAIAAVVVAGLLRHEWAYYLGFGIQVASFALALIVPLMLVLAVVFGALWTAAYVLGLKIEREQAERAA
jgi:hypothetical protein